jgi:hypothetical protein
MSDSFGALLQLHGLRRTPQRLAILQALTKAASSLSAQEILAAVQNAGQVTMDLACALTASTPPSLVYALAVQQSGKVIPGTSLFLKKIKPIARWCHS